MGCLIPCPSRTRTDWLLGQASSTHNLSCFASKHASHSQGSMWKNASLSLPQQSQVSCIMVALQQQSQYQPIPWAHPIHHAASAGSPHIQGVLVIVSHTDRYTVLMIGGSQVDSGGDKSRQAPNATFAHFQFANTLIFNAP